jgi:TonB family protein
MIEAVSDIIAARSREPRGLSKMVAVSVLVHVLGLGVLAFAPTPNYDEPPRTVMTISLGGAPGPRAGGMTAIGGRAVQAVQPTEAPRLRSEAPPAPTKPEMTLPTPNAKPRPPQTRPTQAPRESTGRTPSTGPEPREGSARVETGARGQGFGLSTGGGGGTAGATVDVANFCCPDYLETVVQRIQQNWAHQQNVTGQVIVKFTIQRDGTISQAVVERPSGFVALDSAAHRAVQLARVPPLPAQFQNPDLTVHLRFEYQR